MTEDRFRRSVDRFYFIAIPVLLTLAVPASVCVADVIVAIGSSRAGHQTVCREALQ